MAQGYMFELVLHALKCNEHFWQHEQAARDCDIKIQ